MEKEVTRDEVIDTDDVVEPPSPDADTVDTKGDEPRKKN